MDDLFSQKLTELESDVSPQICLLASGSARSPVSDSDRRRSIAHGSALLRHCSQALVQVRGSEGKALPLVAVRALARGAAARVSFHEIDRSGSSSAPRLPNPPLVPRERGSARPLDVSAVFRYTKDSMRNFWTTTLDLLLDLLLGRAGEVVPVAVRGSRR